MDVMIGASIRALVDAGLSAGQIADVTALPPGAVQAALDALCAPLDIDATGLTLTDSDIADTLTGVGVRYDRLLQDGTSTVAYLGDVIVARVRRSHDDQ